MKKADVDRIIEYMIRERTRQLAEQAGFVLWDGAVDWSSNYDDELEKFTELIRADEREACANVCEAMDHDGVMIADDCAKAIRARGDVHASDISQEPVDETAKDRHEPSDYDKSIHSNPDAQAWAKFFMATVKEQEWCIDDIDEDLMLGWFANAMMAMHDHVKREWVGLDLDQLRNATTQFVRGAMWAERHLKEKNRG